MAGTRRRHRKPSGSPLTAGLGAFLDHIQADPIGWRAVLQARTGGLADIGAAVEEHGLNITLAALGIPNPAPLLRAALDGWAAFERGACLSWLQHPDIPRAAVEDLLMTSFLATLESVARHDEQTRTVLLRLQ